MLQRTSLAHKVSPSVVEHKLLEALEKGHYHTQQAWADAAGVHRRSVVLALSRPRFLELYRAALLRRVNTRVPAVLDAVIQIAERPEHTSHASQRMLLEMTGLYVPKSKQEVSGSMQLDFASLVQGIHAEPVTETTARELPPGDEDPTP